MGTGRRRKEIRLSPEAWRRAEFLRQVMDETEVDRVLEKAVTFLDIVMGVVVIEGSRLYLLHKDGSKEEVTGRL